MPVLRLISILYSHHLCDASAPLVPEKDADSFQCWSGWVYG